MQGRIKIHRQIDTRGRRSKPNTFSLFLYLLTNANTEDKQYLGHTIKRGDCIIGRKTTSRHLGMTEDQLRTSLEHLKTTNEITIKTTNKFSIITICKWEEYQIENKKSPTKSPAVSPTNPQQIPTPKEYKNIEYNIECVRTPEDIKNIMGDEYVNNWKGGLNIMWKYFIDKGYVIEKKEKDILEFMERLTNKSKISFGLKQDGSYARDKTKNAIADCFEHHKNILPDIIKKQSHKSRVNTRFSILNK